MKTSKILDSLEELVGILKVHELELQQDGMLRNEKSVTLKAKQPIRRTPTKALKVEEPSKESNTDDDSMEEKEEDELLFVSRKIHSVWRKKINTPYRGRHIGSASKSEQKEKCKEKPVLLYECKKLGHCRSKWPNLDVQKESVLP